MKKSLIALAALAVVSAASAQSSVTISGAVDVAYTAKDVKSATGANLVSAQGITDGSNTANRLTFDMVEDLGGGLKAGALFETSLNITNGSLLATRPGAAGPAVNAPATGVNAQLTTTGYIPTGAYTEGTNRQSYVKLSGGFGELRAGYQRTNLYEQSTYSGYLAGQEQYGGFLHTLGYASMGGTRSNAITYITPAYQGLSATLQIGSGGDRETMSTDTAAGINGYTRIDQKRQAIKFDYVNGPLNATYGYTKYDETKVAGSATAVYDIYGALSSTAAASTDQSNSMHQLTASYSLGDFRLMGQYINAKVNDKTAANVDQDIKATVLGATYTMGPAAFFAMVGTGTIVKSTVAGNFADYTQQQFGVRYSLSKRTTAYLVNGVSKDKAQTSATGIYKGTITAVGLAHTF